MTMTSPREIRLTFVPFPPYNLLSDAEYPNQRRELETNAYTMTSLLSSIGAPIRIFPVNSYAEQVRAIRNGSADVALSTDYFKEWATYDQTGLDYCGNPVSNNPLHIDLFYPKAWDGASSQRYNNIFTTNCLLFFAFLLTIGVLWPMKWRPSSVALSTGLLELLILNLLGASIVQSTTESTAPRPFISNANELARLLTEENYRLALVGKPDLVEE